MSTIISIYFYILQIVPTPLTEVNEFLGLSLLVWNIILIPIFIALLKFFEIILSKTLDYFREKKFRISQKEKSFDEKKDEVLVPLEIGDKEKNSVIENIIKSYLENIRKKLKADRVFIAKFHNGTDMNEIYPGDVFQVYTIVEESLGAGVSSEKNYFKNIPTAFYKTILDDLLKNKKLFFNDISKIESNEIKYVFRYQGIKSFGAIGIFDPTKNMIGVLGIEFVKENRDIEEKDLEYLTDNSHYFVDWIKKYKIKKGEN